METRNRYGHSFVLAFSAPSVPQDFRFNEHTQRYSKAERETYTRDTRGTHTERHTHADARRCITDGRMQFTTVYEQSLSVFPSWVTFRHGSCTSVRGTDRDEEREREREKGITGNEFSRVHAWFLELLFSPSFLLGPPLQPLRGLVGVLRRLWFTHTLSHPFLPLSLSSYPFFDSQESINQRSSGAPCYRHDERWKYRAHARDITEARLGYVGSCVRRPTTVTTFVTPCPLRNP